MHMLEELLYYEILVRLPVRSLLRFKSVCKSWRSLVRSRHFINIYTQHHRRDYQDYMVLSPYITDPELPTRLLSCSPHPTSVINLGVTKQLDVVLPPDITCHPLASYESRDPMNRVFVRVLGPTSNGIYCLAAQRFYYSPPRIMFYNPATRECKLMAPLPLRTKQVFPLQLGFGVAKLDYKVVVVIADMRDSFSSFVYSLKRGTWEKTPTDVLTDRVRRIESGFEVCPQGFLNGSWHWMAKRLDISSPYKYAVLSFDMEEEVFSLISGPPSNCASSMCDENAVYTVKRGVSVLNDRLAAIYLRQDLAPIYLNHEDKACTIDVWMMMEYGVEDSWTKIYSVRPECGFAARSLVGVSSPERDEGGIRIQRVFFQDYRGRVFSCDDVGATLYGECDIARLISWNILGISSYTETLEPLHIEDNGEEQQIEDNTSVSYCCNERSKREQ